MSTTYRVDRNNVAAVPCGTNAIVYVGNSFDQARNAFARNDVGIDAWGNTNNAYGLVMSKWNGYCYEVLRTRNIETKERA